MISAELREKLETIEDLPTLPAIALRLIELGRNPNSSTLDVEKTLINDPALVARILQVANSPLYGARQCDNLREALLLLGVDGALSLALVMVIMQLQRGLEMGLPKDALNLSHYWRRSILSALAARVLGRILRRRDCEQLFLTALVQDIGVLLLARIQPALYQTTDQTSHRHWEQIELSALQTGHALVSAWVLNKWDMPEYMTGAVAHSHLYDAEHLTHLGVFERCIVFSGALADIYLDDRLSSSLTELPTHLAAHLNIDVEMFEEILAQMTHNMLSMESIFQVPMLTEEECARKIKQAKVAMTFRML